MTNVVLTPEQAIALSELTAELFNRAHGTDAVAEVVLEVENDGFISVTVKRKKGEALTGLVEATGVYRIGTD